jgi:hypothetical protein
VGRLSRLGQIGPLGQMAAGLEERKEKKEIYFGNDFQLKKYNYGEYGGRNNWGNS